MTFPRRTSATHRRAIWLRNQREDGMGGKCCLCPDPIRPGIDRWEEHHTPIPHCWGGEESELAHKRCHRIETSTVTAPMLAKSRHQVDKATDVKAPGLGPCPLPGGRRAGDPRKKKMNGQVVDRRTGEPWQTH